MAVLKRAGLVESQKQGLWTFYQLRKDLPTEARKALEILA
jgi:DNA-binding transcriptional ArsR family regulator